jgi:hypothetical protein
VEIFEGVSGWGVTSCEHIFQKVGTPEGERRSTTKRRSSDVQKVGTPVKERENNEAPQLKRAYELNDWMLRERKGERKWKLER